jgi:hypothetical protein
MLFVAGLNKFILQRTTNRIENQSQKPAHRDILGYHS